jgi:signal transduction histidine kinase
MAAIGQTITGLAHEARNALQRGHTFLERLGWRLKDRREDLTLVDGAREALDDVLRLYEDVREFAAPIRLSFQSADLARVWREAWSDLSPARVGRDVRFQETFTGVHLACVVDAQRLKQVFRNIFDNALAACPDPVVITVVATEETAAGQPGVRLTIRDNGPGLTPEQRQRIFEPFYTTKSRGTGLGMAICERIIDAHGGMLAVGAPDGPGTEIVLWLPRNRA